MEFWLSVLVALYFAASIYLMLSTHTIRLILGVALLSNAVNLLIFAGGRVTPEIPPFVPAGLSAPEAAIANPLPQALILTAIVIGFSFFAFLLVLVYRAYEDLGTDDTTEMKLSEPLHERPPSGY